MYSITAKAKPKWHHIRWKLSNYFVGVATWIYPENPAVRPTVSVLIRTIAEGGSGGGGSSGGGLSGGNESGGGGKGVFVQLMIDQMIYGRSVTRIDPSKIVDEPNKD